MKRFLCALLLAVCTAAPALADSRADLFAAMSQMAAVTSMHANAVVSGRTVDIDYAPPGKMHLTSAQFELIKIDQTTWVKIGGAWRQFALPGMDQITGVITGAVGSASTHANDAVVTDLGIKSPDGVPLHAYSVVDKPGDKPVTLYTGGGYIVRVDSADGGIVRFSNYNQPVDIHPPM